jgi:hypothetical protein
MSRQELADAVNAYLYREHKVKDKLNQDHIGKIERGQTRWPGEWRRLGFRAVLDAPSDTELGFWFYRSAGRMRDVTVGDAPEGDASAAATPGRAPIKRERADGADTDAQSWTPGGSQFDGIEVFDLRELEEVLRGRARLGNEGLNLLEHSCVRIDQSYAQYPPLVVLPMVSLQIRRLVRVLGEPQQVTHRRRLCSAVGRLAGLRGWLLFDLANHEMADSWYDTAIEAAREAEDDGLCGWLFGARSLIPSYRHDHKAALAAVEQGQAAARNTSDSTVRAWLAALEMRARAGLLDSPGCHAARRRAERLAVASRPTQRRHGMDFDGGTLDLTYYIGTSLLLLHQPDPAAALLRASMEALPGTHAKARAVLLLSLATAAGQRGKLDEVCELVRQALTVAGGQPIMPIAQRAWEVRRQIGPPGEPALAALDEHLEDFARALRAPTPGLPA